MTLSYLSYELANNPEVQARLQEEIDEAFEDADDQFPDYSIIQSLPYLDMVIHETLRYHPPVGMNWRHAMRLRWESFDLLLTLFETENQL